MPIAWLRKYKANCFVGVLISIAFDLRFGMWQSMQAVVSRSPISVALGCWLGS